MTTIGDGGAGSPKQAKADDTHSEATELPHQAPQNISQQDRYQKATTSKAALLDHHKLQPDLNPGKIAFNHADLAYLVEQFGIFMQANPQANHQARAKFFVQTILKHKRWAQRLQAYLSEKELNDMYDLISQLLDAPGPGGLVETISRHAGHLPTVVTK